MNEETPTAGAAEVPRTQEEARAALLRVAEDQAFREDYTRVAGYCSKDDLREIVDLAWRYQFAKDRTPFKKAIRELDLHVSTKARKAEEWDS